MKKGKRICKNQSNYTKLFVASIAFFSLTIFFGTKVMAQEQHQKMVRLAKIKVDPSQLDKYNAALKEQMKTAVSSEPGVLTYYAVADKNDPSNITILEIYADTAAYQSHILTPHFKKYKDTVKDMVTSLELVDVTLIASAKNRVCNRLTLSTGTELLQQLQWFILPLQIMKMIQMQAGFNL